MKEHSSRLQKLLDACAEIPIVKKLVLKAYTLGKLEAIDSILDDKKVTQDFSVSISNVLSKIDTEMDNNL